MTSAITIRFVERFPEPAFSELQREIFAPLERSLAEFRDAVHGDRSANGSVDPGAFPPMVRYGAYDGEQLVGWTIGWFQRPDRFIMSNSGVVPSHRRQGIYSRLVNAAVDHAQTHGAGTVHSW